MLRHLRTGLITSFAACASPAAPTGAYSGAGSTVQTSVEADCPPDWCGGNSPKVGLFGLWEINLDYQPNDQGFILLGMSQGSTFYDLDVRDSAFVGLDSNGDEVLSGSQLAGSILWLKRGGEQFGIEVAAVNNSFHEVVESSPGYFAPIETYVLRWSWVRGQPLRGAVHAGDSVPVPVRDNESMPVCAVWNEQTTLSRYTGRVPAQTGEQPRPYSHSDWDDGVSWNESTVLPPFNMVVFEGDRINATTRTVNPAADNRWFNLGCALHTLAKMRLTRNTLNTVANGDWRRVQATLKMLSADYCGNGTAFTVGGTPILWRQNPPGMTYRFQPQPGALEARWNENGAICLGTPRLAVHPIAEFPDLAKSIRRACAPSRGPGLPEEPRPRPCRGTDLFISGDELITTANYTPP
jgi:hypothetical protein